MINYMALVGVHFQMATVIGGKKRITATKDMEQPSGRVERDTRVNTSRVRNTGMEKADTQVEQCIMENTNRVRKMVMGIASNQMGMNTTESSRMIVYRERESLKRVTNCSESSVTKASLSAKLNSMLHLKNDITYYKFTLYST